MSMDSPDQRTGPPVDVAVIGGGPAGLAAACALKQAGIQRVVVLEREPEAGGIPRHCSHSPFGMREFKRVLPGPQYARRLVARARALGVEIRTRTTVVEARPQGHLLLTTPAGMQDLTARRVIYATGVRETPRSARLISGPRLRGVLNTGAVQGMVHLAHRRPFRRPVIIGSELVAFSAILTCRSAGIRPVAMIEPGPQVLARWPSALFPALVGVRLYRGTELLEIGGAGSVDHVRVRAADGCERRIDCDGVILSGKFTPEASLARRGHLAVDPGTGGPRVDQWGRCSDPAYFACGNLLRPVETAGWSWNEGRMTGRRVAADLAGKLPGQDREIVIELADARLKYVMPQRLSLPDGAGSMAEFQLRVRQKARGTLVARDREGIVWQSRFAASPERRLLVPLSMIAEKTAGKTVRLGIEEPVEELAS